MRQIKKFLYRVFQVDNYREYMGRLRAEKVVTVQAGETSMSGNRTAIYYSRVRR